MKNMTYAETKKVGHPALGLLLGFLGIAAALLLVFLTGVVGAGIAAIFGLTAILLGARACKGGKGVGAIATGALSILLAAILLVSVIGLFTTMRDKAIETGMAPLVAKYVEDPHLGLLGIAMHASQDEVAASEFMDQMSLLMKETEPETVENVHEEAAVILEAAVRI